MSMAKTLAFRVTLSTVALSTVAFSTLALPTVAAARTEVDSVFDARSNGEIEIEGVDGKLTIHGWQRSEIQVRGFLGDAIEQLDVKQAERWTRLAIERPASGERAAAIDLSAELEIFVPADSSLQIRTLAATVSIAGVDGPLNIETVTGAIDATGQPTTATLRSVSGTMDLQLDTPELKARSVSGAITIRGQVGDLQAATVDAELRVEGSVGVEGQLSSVTGAVRFDAELAAVARLRARSSSGAIYLTLPPSSTDATKFRLGSFSGELINTSGEGFGEGFGEDFGEGYRRQLEFGNGPRIVDLETFDGPIHLQSQ